MPDPRDDQESAENVDSEMVSDVDDDPEGSLAFPPDRPLGVEDYGTRASEERVDEPLEERLRREVPDPAAWSEDVDDPEEVRLELDGEDAASDDADDRLDRVAPVGRLVDPGADDDSEDLDDEEPDAVADLADGSDLSAEEAAIHLTGAPPFRADD